MRRHAIDVRKDWQKKVERVGLTYHTLESGLPYWDESAYWEFSAAEIDRLEAATAELQQMALAAGDAILERGWLSRMGIPEAAKRAIRATWQSEPPALYSRMDLAYDGRTIKLLEYNADTPTALVEAAVAQWYWLEDRFPERDQFNSLHEKLVAKWKDLKPYLSEPVYFTHDGATHDGAWEDAMTVAYLADTAQQAGIDTKTLAMRQIGWDSDRTLFVDMRNRPIETVFKLYPWEWLLKDRFGEHALATMNAESQKPVKGKVQWIEPAWKMLWSNKALLAILWELYPEHELLLPAYLDDPHKMQNYVRKPLLGREGAGVSVFRNYAWQEGAPVKADAGEDGFVYQAMASLAQIDKGAMIVGSWLIDGEPAGMGIRESDGMITTNTSRFVPHLFR
ncbi:MAG TPA: glutathionylspermidine synthase family protein [Acidobacteriaceae bacterium]|nr:glutathionylspermidine synthase family protein [Acidobacteriaceae bacterium]